MAHRTWTRSLGLLMALALLTSSGCKSTRWPTLFQPGPTEYQRYNAIEHDPYPDPYQGPEALGTRPRDYQRPLNDSQRYPSIRGANNAMAPAAW
jgi:hypothetical protein